LPRSLTQPDGVPAAAGDGGRESFDDIYGRHFPFVWRCLRSLGVPRAALDDAAQEVFLVVHRRLPEFAGHSTIRTWLFGIVRRVAFNQRRATQRRLAHEAERQSQADTTHVPVQPGPLDSVANAEAAAFIERFMANLPDRQREVFVLVMIEGMSVPDVAEALSIPLNTAYTRLRSARADLRRAMAEREGRDG
jgi:RNA polymerase sigma-70 factor (ECF subfamily)